MVKNVFYLTLTQIPLSCLLATIPDQCALLSPISHPVANENPQASSSHDLVRVGHNRFVSRSQPRNPLHRLRFSDGEFVNAMALCIFVSVQLLSLSSNEVFECGIKKAQHCCLFLLCFLKFKIVTHGYKCVFTHLL